MSGDFWPSESIINNELLFARPRTQPGNPGASSRPELQRDRDLVFVVSRPEAICNFWCIGGIDLWLARELLCRRSCLARIEAMPLGEQIEISFRSKSVFNTVYITVHKLYLY